MYRTESDQEKITRLEKSDTRNRERSKKYLEKVKKAGFKQISAFLDAGAYDELCKRRDAAIQAGKPISFGDIIGGLLVPAATVDNSNVKIDLSIDKKDNVNIDAKKQSIKIDDIPDCQGKDLSIDERDHLLVKVGEMFPGPKNAQQRADVLNNKGVPLKGSVGQWTKKNAGDNIRLATNRLKK